MEYKVVINDFSGPLDLLLHLIKDKEMDLETLNVSNIIDQYLQYIHAMQSSQLEVLSEYLVMAVDLLEMKSKLLLPVDKEEIVPDSYELDPGEQLKHRLRIYKIYKEAAKVLHTMQEERQKYNTKPLAMMSAFQEEVKLPAHIEVYDMMRAMQKLIQRKALQAPRTTNIAKKDISIEERMEEIQSYMKLNQRVALEDLIEKKDRTYFVVTFLSVLVLAKYGDLRLMQEDLLAPIFLEGYDGKNESV